MRIISIRPDESSVARLQSLCQFLGLSQTEDIKPGQELLQRQTASSAALANRLGLIGSFSSAPPGAAPTSGGRDHSSLLRQKLRGQLRQQQGKKPKC